MPGPEAATEQPDATQQHANESDLQQCAHQIYKPRSLTAPLVCSVHFLTALNHPYHFVRMSEDVFYFRREIIDISQFKKDEFLRTEIVRNPPRSGSDDRLALAQKLKNARRGNEFSESAPPIRNDANVALTNGLGDLLEFFWA
jgi:hypothetical protein